MSSSCTSNNNNCKQKIRNCKYCNKELPEDCRSNRYFCTRKCVAKYVRHTKDGKIQAMYKGIKTRSQYSSYLKDLPSFKDFYQFTNNSLEFHTLFNRWKESEFEYLLMPSPDRKNTSLGYRLDNIQFLTLNDNLKKADSEITPEGKKNKKIKSGMPIRLIKNNNKHEFISLGDAGRFLHINSSDISYQIRRNNFIINGWKIEILDKKIPEPVWIYHI